MKNVDKQRAVITISVIVGLLLVALLPLAKPPVYYLSLLFSVFLYIVYSESWNILGGYTGYFSFGHVAFPAMGGYLSAVLLRGFGLSPFLTCLLGGLLASAAAGLIGYPVLRLKGPYFAIVTFLFSEILAVVAINWDWIGGSTGLWLKSMQASIDVNRSVFYEVMLILAIVATLLARQIERSKFGRGLACIREDEEVAESLGIDAPMEKLKAFIISAFLPGVAGGIYAYYTSYIEPGMMFSVHVSILMMLMALFGGSRTWLGPLIGAVILSVLNEYLGMFVAPEMARILFGLLFVLVILFMPNGIMGYRMNRR